MMPYRHLEFWERKVIKKMIDDGFSNRRIAKFLNRNPSTICREIKRNSTSYWYHPIHAQDFYNQRRKDSKFCKLDVYSDLQAHVIASIKNKHSPDAIAGRLKLQYKNNPEKCVSHETVYRWILKQACVGDDLYTYLARGRKRRRNRHSKRKIRMQIPHRVSIHSRPRSVLSGKVIGHWEGDTIIGEGHQGCIATVVERKSLFLVAGLMKDKRPSTCNRAILEAFAEIPNRYIKTITFDNGLEFYHHYDLQEALECQNYFADPYSAWQRGKNEQINGMLRRYFPKNMSFANLSQNDVDEAVKNLNNTPRKSLGYRTPYEVFYGINVAPQN